MSMTTDGSDSGWDRGARSKMPLGAQNEEWSIP